MTHPAIDPHNNSQALVTVAPQSSVALTATDVRQQVNLIQQVMQAVMQEGIHYGKIPGTDKPTLLQPGAQKLGVTFRFTPSFLINKTDLGNGHREYEITCTLTHIPTGAVVGQGVGSCSTMESKYRYRYASKKCPTCQKETIIKGKEEYGGGWICFRNKGGCGAKFGENDAAISNQASGKVENPDIADIYNTVLKIGKKRAYVDATLTATAASDIFTQDLEDVEETPAVLPPRQPAAPKQQPPPVPSADTRLITEGQQKRLFPLLKEASVSVEDFKAFLLEHYQVEHTKDITRSQYDAICQDITGGGITAWLVNAADEQEPEEEPGTRG